MRGLSITMIKLSFGTDMKARVTLTVTEAARLRDHLASLLPSSNPKPMSDVAAAAMAVEAARKNGKQ